MESAGNKKKISLLSQWKNRDKKSPDARLPLELRPENTTRKPSSGQQRIWFLQQRYPDNPFYLYAQKYFIRGAVDLSILEKSFKALIDRHSILRSNYKMANGELVMTLQNQPNFSIEVTDHVDATTLLNSSFDLSSDLLLKVFAVEKSDAKIELTLLIHHIIGDRQSLDIINDELFKIYHSLKAGQSSVLQDLTIQYEDFAHWESKKSVGESSQHYWKNQLAGPHVVLDLPHDYKRPTAPTFRGNILEVKLDKKLSSDFLDLAKNTRTTAYNAILTAFKISLYRYTEQEDILVGSPFSNRDQTELENLIGFFNETLVIRSQISGDKSFNELLAQIKATTLEAIQHKDITFDDVVTLVKPVRTENINPIFQSMFVYTKINGWELSFSDFEVSQSEINLGHSKFDLTLFALENKDGVTLKFEYSTDIFQEETIRLFAASFKEILSSIVENPDAPVGSINILSSAQKELQLNTWNDTQIDYPSFENIHQSIVQHAKSNPDKTVAVDQYESLTYGALNQMSDYLAHQLIEQGVKKNEFVGLYIGREIHMVVDILAILKAGAAYLPLDPNYPSDRISFMVEDAKVKTIVTTAKLEKQLAFFEGKLISFPTDTNAEISEIDFEKHKLPNVSKEDFAYIIYTSGSTGKPKGVPITHGQLMHSTYSRYSFYPSNPKSFLLLSSFSFDSSIVGIFWTMCAGGKLVIPERRIEQNVTKLTTIIHEEKVSHTLMLPSLYASILEFAAADKLYSLENVMVAGEACNPNLISAHFDLIPTAKLYNEYGPTEASVWCIAHEITANETAPVPIGRPIPNTQAYILNRYHQPVPAGVAGELYIGGMGVADGYLNRSALTQEKFIPNPFSDDHKNSPLYRTGDLAKFRKNGVIDFLGRVDQQIKIRGFRVELEEIENKIKSLQNVESCVVLVKQDEANENTKKLVAFYNADQLINQQSISDELVKSLPAYMVPTQFFALEKFPILPNGKINRKKLQAQIDSMTLDQAQIAKTIYEAPSNELEESLQSIWQDVLKIEKIGINDNFFGIGGDSLLSIRILAKAAQIGLSIEPNLIFSNQTIHTLAAALEKSSNSKPEKLSVSDLEEIKHYPLSQLQKAFLFNHQSGVLDSGQLELTFHLEGELNIAMFQKAWELAAKSHDSLRLYVSGDEAIAEDSVVFPWTIIQHHISAQKKVTHQKSKPKLDLFSAPVSQFEIHQTRENKYSLIWHCHHIFLDGWSCGIIIKDVLDIYDRLKNNADKLKDSLPGFLTYQKWLDEKPSAPRQNFWKNNLANFHTPLLFERKPEIQSTRTKQSFDDVQSFIEIDKYDQIKSFARTHHVSIATFLQGLWALTLNRIFETDDVVFGNTVSGRFTDFPQLEQMSGLFMNVIPQRIGVAADKTIFNWLQNIHLEQGKTSTFEHTTLNEISHIIDWPVQTPMFDILFVFGNFLRESIVVGDIKINSFEGGFSTSYPLTIRINPTDHLELTLRFDEQYLNQEQAHTIDKLFHSIIQQVLDTPHQTLAQLGESVDYNTKYDIRRIDVRSIASNEDYDSTADLSTKNASSDSFQTTLHHIWSKHFQLEDLSMTDDFFDLGGNSIMALQIFAQLEKTTGIIIPPATLFNYPTIENLAKWHFESTSARLASEIVIPLRSTGDQSPLFCLHGGGGHVFFYKDLTKYIDDDIPIYTLQPMGLSDGVEMHGSIEEMATRYVKEIKLIQPNGPYRLLGTCFSNAVALEMSHQLNMVGEAVSFLGIVDSGPLHLGGTGHQHAQSTVGKFLELLKRGDLANIQKKIKSRFSKSKVRTYHKEINGSASEAALDKTIDALNNMYAAYHWRPTHTKIQFFRSTEFLKRADKKYHISQWKKLAPEGVKVHLVEGHHVTLFEEPEVQDLGQKIDEAINGLQLVV